MKRLLPSIMVLLLVLGIAMLADAQDSAAGNGKKKTLKDLIVGKWEPESQKEAKGSKGKFFIEFTKDSKFTITIKLDEETAKLSGKAEVTVSGTYKVLDNDIVETTTNELGKEKLDKAKVVVTENSISFSPLEGKNKDKEQKFKRVK